MSAQGGGGTVVLDAAGSPGGPGLAIGTSGFYEPLGFGPGTVRAHKIAAVYYGISIASLIGLFVLLHVSHRLHQLRSHRGTLAKSLAAPLRLYRKLALRKIPKFTSVGHFFLILAFVGLNVGFMFWRMTFFPNTAYFAKRAGWMAVNNTALTFFLGMKNSPLAWLTGYSYERLNVLHRWAGRSVWVYSCLHVFLFCQLFVSHHTEFKFVEVKQIYGFLAFVAYTIILCSSFEAFRRRFYECFYWIHLTMFILVITGLSIHNPAIYQNVIILSGAFWVFDRLIRVGRAVYYSIGNTATIFPLAGGSTKIVLTRPVTFTPGSHAFLSIPRIRLFQTHPFTISSPSNVEFTVRAQRGFTRDLYNLAVKEPGMKLRCGFDGPYGAVPDHKRYNHVVLFAGGSGGSFTFAVALDIVRDLPRSSVVSMEFVWVIRKKDDIALYVAELEELGRCPNVNIRIFLTGSSPEAQELVTSHPSPIPTPLPTPLTSRPSTATLVIQPQIKATDYVEISKEKNPVVTQGIKLLPPVHTRPSSSRISGEDAARLVVESSSFPPANSMALNSIESILEYGRPGIESIIHEVMSAAKEDDLVGVSACGPKGLMRAVRNAVAKEIRITGASVSLHCEQFSWG